MNNQMNLFTEKPKVGDVVESIHWEGKIRVTKVYETFIVGEEIGFVQECKWYPGTRILSFANMKK